MTKLMICQDGTWSEAIHCSDPRFDWALFDSLESVFYTEDDFEDDTPDDGA